MRDSTSSAEYVPASWSPNVAMTSYGVARLPYTTRSANRLARARTGWNTSATTAAASAESTGLCADPTSAPTPTTKPTYTRAMTAAITAKTTVLRITTSMS